MMKLLQIVMVACLLALAGCGRTENGSQADTQNTLQRVQRTGVLRVGFFPFEPATMLDPGATRPRGFFVDLIEDIARDMRWKVDYIQVDLQNFAAGLNSGQYDLSIGATFSSPSRAGGVLFSEPLFYLGYTGVTIAAQVSRFKSWDHLDRKGVRVAVKQGSAIADYVRVHFRNATIVVLDAPNLNAPLAAVPAQADVGLMNQVTVFTYLRDNPDKTSAVAGNSQIAEIFKNEPKEFTGICWAVRSDDLRFLEFINAGIKHEIDTGRYDEYIVPYDIPYLYKERKTFTYQTKNYSGELSQ